MEGVGSAFDEVVTLRQAKQLIQCMAHEQSFLLLSPPGLGKSELVYEAAREAGLPCRSLLGTQIAPEDVSGIPRIVGERSVFCPPRVLLPEKPEPFCLFLDELPACSPDVQKAFYSLLLERRLGEHALPRGTWVVSAGNRLQDRALVRAMSSALVNRVTILQLRVDAGEWLAWAERAGVRPEIRSFVSTIPDALMRPVPADPVPFSTPRAWALLSRALDLAQRSGLLTNENRRALAFGRLSPEDAVVFCALAEDAIGALRPLDDYLRKPELLPKGDSARWFVLDCVRRPHRHGRDLGCARGRAGDAGALAQSLGRMTAVPESRPDHRAIRARLLNGLRLVTAPFPHLSGLAAAVRLEIDERVPTMGVFASGRLLANPGFSARLSTEDLVFVLAHELLHLALRTHDRARGSAALEFNYAHDYIINDMLRHALGLTAIPAGGLDMQGARLKSAEEIVLEMRRNGISMQTRTQVWEGIAVTVEQVLGAARQAPAGSMGDALDVARERELFPESAAEQAERARAIKDLAAKGMILAKAMGALRGQGTASGTEQRNVRPGRGLSRTPWHVALQTWLEGVAPGERTYLRASRRGADHGEVVMPGRKRHSWRLSVILDTSASMDDEVPRALGAIANFCDMAGVDEIRVIQCDTTVTSDETLSPSALAEYEISGYGGSDLTPAMVALAEDARVSAAVIITDGEISYPQEPPPYAVLWALPKPSASFQPPYGRIVTLETGASS